MNQIFTTLSLGFLLGIKHAFDTDHVLAVSTMVSEHKNPFKAALIGAFWGMGHTITLFLVGITVLLLKIQIPKNISLSFELLVGVMLVFLGVKVFYRTPFALHIHPHKHTNYHHIHSHYHINKYHLHRHYKSFLIGTVHGLAGSGALTILVLSTIRSILEGMYYILLFGIGSIAAMTLISIILGLPFIYSTQKLPILERYLNIITGTLSIIFGLFIIYEIGFIEGLFPGRFF